jgi:hypothetical protein
MRAPLSFAALFLVIGTGACATGSSDTAQDDFKRDLQLASATNLDLAAPAVNPALLTKLETAPAAEPMPVKTIKPAPIGDQAIESDAPTVEATPEPEPAPVQESEPVAQAPAPAPVPEEINEPVAVAPRPQPIPATPAGGRGAGDYGRGGGVFGGGIGVVIRGGGVGGDNCEIHRPRGVIYRSPVYSPRPLGPATSTPAPVATPRGVRVTRVAGR